MEPLKKRWQNVPVRIRKPIVLVVGALFIVAAAITGPLPGPGGIPIFLAGIAILASEFEWAQRLRVVILWRLTLLGKAWRARKLVGTLLLMVVIAVFGALSFLIYHYVRS